MTKDSCQVLIDGTPERLYGLIADLTRMGEWSPECVRVEWEDGATGAVEGARFTGHCEAGPGNRFKWARRGRVLVAEPHREFAFVTEEGGRDSTVWRYRLEPTADGTRVTESYEVRWIPASARILDVPTNRHRQLQKGMRHTLERLKSTAEAEVQKGDETL